MPTASQKTNVASSGRSNAIAHPSSGANSSRSKVSAMARVQSVRLADIQTPQ